MIKLNLLPEEYRVKEKKSFALPSFASPKGLLYFLAFLIVIEIGVFLFTRIALTPKYNEAKKEMAGLSSRLTMVRIMKNQVSDKQDIGRQLDLSMKAPFYWAEFLNGISDGMIQGVWLSHLTLQRREFDVISDKEEKKKKRAQRKLLERARKLSGDKKKSSKPKINKKKGKKAKRNRDKKKKGNKEKRVVVMLRGRMVGHGGEETALISRYIQSLQEQPSVDTIMEDIILENITRVKVGKQEYYDFTIYLKFKNEYHEEFKYF